MTEPDSGECIPAETGAAPVHRSRTSPPWVAPSMGERGPGPQVPESQAGLWPTVEGLPELYGGIQPRRCLSGGLLSQAKPTLPCSVQFFGSLERNENP